MTVSTVVKKNRVAFCRFIPVGTSLACIYGSFKDFPDSTGHDHLGLLSTPVQHHTRLLANMICSCKSSSLELIMADPGSGDPLGHLGACGKSGLPLAPSDVFSRPLCSQCTLAGRLGRAGSRVSEHGRDISLARYRILRATSGPVPLYIITSTSIAAPPRSARELIEG